MLLSEDKFQEHVLKKLDEITGLFIQNEKDHGDLSSKIESVRGDLSSKIESVRTEIHKNFHSYLR